MESGSASSFGAWFREQRLAAKMTQDDVSDESGVHKVTVSQIESGKIGVSKTKAIKLARAVSADIDEACLKAGFAPPSANEPEIEEEREIKRIMRRIPAPHRPGFVRAMRAVADSYLTPA